MSELVGTLLGSVLSGGATGLIGVGLQRWADYQNKKLDVVLEEKRLAAALEQRKIDVEISRQEWASKTQIATVEGETKVDVAQSEAFAESLKAQAVRYSAGKETGAVANFLLVMLDLIAGLVRPALTVYLCVLTSYIWFQVSALLQKEDLDAAEVMQLWMLIVQTILYLTTTCVLWWFGTRNRGPLPRQK